MLAPMNLAEVVERHRVIVCVGSGGVGKTTTSAAIALHAALAGHNTLCLTIDPARRLANSLGLDAIDHEIRRVPDTLFERHGLQPQGALSALMLDMKHTFDELVERYASSSEQRDRILHNQLYQYVSTSLAGTQEYMAMEKLHEVRQESDYDLIVLDTPPTTNALDFLDAPQKLVGAIDSPVMRWFVEALEGSKGLSLLGKGAGFVLKGMGRLTGAEFLELVAQFVTELNSLFGGFRDRAQQVYDDLRGDDVAFVIVTSPSPLAVAEAVFFSKKLADYRITPKAIVVNRVHGSQPLSSTREQLLSELRGAAPQLDDPERLLTALLQAQTEADATAAHDSEGVRRLQSHVGNGMSYTHVPALDRDVHDLSSLHQVAESFSIEPAVPAAGV